MKDERDNYEMLKQHLAKEQLALRKKVYAKYDKIHNEKKPVGPAYMKKNVLKASKTQLGKMAVEEYESLSKKLESKILKDYGGSKKAAEALFKVKGKAKKDFDRASR